MAAAPALLLGRPPDGHPALVAARRACEERTRTALGDRTYEAAFRSGFRSGRDTELGVGVARVLGDEG